MPLEVYSHISSSTVIYIVRLCLCEKHAHLMAKQPPWTAGDWDIHKSFHIVLPVSFVTKSCDSQLANGPAETTRALSCKWRRKAVSLPCLTSHSTQLPCCTLHRQALYLTWLMLVQLEKLCHFSFISKALFEVPDMFLTEIHTSFAQSCLKHHEVLPYSFLGTQMKPVLKNLLSSNSASNG